MAIWPFGRKNKRHTIQVSADEATTLQHALDEHVSPAPVAEPTLGRKPSRRDSKRHSRRWSRSGDGSESIGPTGQTTASNRPISSLDQRRLSEADQTYPQPLSRKGSLLKKQPNPSGPNKLRKSKKQTDEILREREIKLLSSTPIDIPRRSTQPVGSDYGAEHRRRRANGRRADRYMSDISLSIRDSAASSFSDTSDPFTYKVNAFAALTPRPVVRYVETPRLPTARSNNTSTGVGRTDNERHPNRTASGEDLYYSRRRVDDLADSLDASTLRELLERDRRRREKRQLEEQERLRRKLQERADAQAAEERQQAIQETQQPPKVEPGVAPVIEAPDVVERQSIIIEETIAEEPEDDAPAEQGGTWLQDETREGADAPRESIESVHVIGNIDDSSIREPTLAARPSFARSHEMGLSRTTLSPSQSSLRHGISSHSQSQTFGIGSTSDISERHPSETSGRRGGNTITSLLRRGSSRIKRRYKERFHDSSPDVSNASHESFYRIQTQSSPPPPSIVPPRAFIPTGVIQRSQSKFTEHFGDEPMSPPDSRLETPDIPEEVDMPEDRAEPSLENEEGSTFLHGPTPTLMGVDIVNTRKGRHLSGDSFESEIVPLSQSLASIDSEGSWMSGQFFRRLSQKQNSSPVRTMTSFSAAMDSPVEQHDDVRDSIDSRRASSNIMGEAELLENDDVHSSDASKSAETWHHSEFGRRAVLVNPVSRPKSTTAMLKSFPSLSPITAEEDYIDEDVPEDKVVRTPPQPQRVTSVHGVICNAEDD